MTAFVILVVFLVVIFGLFVWDICSKKSIHRSDKFTMISVVLIILIIFALTMSLVCEVYDVDYTSAGCLSELKQWNDAYQNPELSLMITEALSDKVLRKSEYEDILNFTIKLSTKQHFDQTLESANKVVDKLMEKK